MNPISERLLSIKLCGPTIHHSWYREILLPDGRADLEAITLLAHFVYKYLPVQTRSGEWTPKFKTEFLETNLADLARLHGMSIDAVIDALDRLQDRGLIEVTTPYEKGNITPSMTLRVKLDVDALTAVTTGTSKKSSILPAATSSATSSSGPVTAPASEASQKRSETLPPRAASAAPTSGLEGPELERRVNEFIHYWRLLREQCGYAPIITEADRRSIRKLHSENPSLRVGKLMAVAVWAWLLDYGPRPPRDLYDPWHACRGAHDAQHFCAHLNSITRELDYHERPWPMWVREELVKVGLVKPTPKPAPPASVPAKAKPAPVATSRQAASPSALPSTTPAPSPFSSISPGSAPAEASKPPASPSTPRDNLKRSLRHPDQPLPWEVDPSTSPGPGARKVTGNLVADGSLVGPPAKATYPPEATGNPRPSPEPPPPPACQVRIATRPQPSADSAGTPAAPETPISTDSPNGSGENQGGSNPKALYTADQDACMLERMDLESRPSRWCPFARHER